MGEMRTEEQTTATIYDMAVQLLEERSAEEGWPDTEAWTTGSEIAHRTNIDKHVVFDALRAMSHQRLYVRDVGHDIEVIGVVHHPITT